jgi:5-formyltetrahydrofolate cyclo-ligase
LRAQPLWVEAKSVLFYAPLLLEPDLSPLMTDALAGGKTIALPRFVRETGCYAAFQVTNPAEDLTRGNFGILEPLSTAPSVPLNQLDLALVPGIAFDLDGRRLGRGKGFYDRLLAAVPGAKCGVAFDQQVVREVPVESHDILMNFLLTPTRWLAVSRSAA